MERPMLSRGRQLPFPLSFLPLGRTKTGHVGHIFGGAKEWVVFEGLIVLVLGIHRGIPLGWRTQAIVLIRGL